MMIFRKTKRMTATLLAVLFVLPCFCVPSDAAKVETINDATEKARMLNEFNAVVNAVKDNRPGLTVLATGEMKKNPDAEGDTMTDVANLIVENVFKNEKSLTADLFGMLKNDSTQDWQSKEVKYVRGELNLDKIPVSGETYVSGLTTQTKFTMKRLRNESAKTTEILIQFPDCTLIDALKSDMRKVFDLPTNTDISLNEDNSVVLEDGVFQLDDIACTNAYVDIIYNDNLQLVTYTSNINYRVTVRMYTVLEKLWPLAFNGLRLLGFDTGKIAQFNPVEIIMSIIGLAVGFDPESAMSESDIITNYVFKHQMFGFDWSPRYFGDFNADNRVTADDARSILRCCVGLDTFKTEGDRFYCDTDFNGKIQAADARTALRMSVNLDQKYTSKAQYDKIKEDNTPIPDPILPEVPDTPPMPEVPEVPAIPIV